ncbi:MAG: hypothetical protein SPM04_09575 [Lachnospira sp.]|nr:hypothetical protein [Lachnospira sp.]
MNKNKKIMAALLAGTMIVTSVTPAMAEAVPSSKEEVVYVNLTSGGSVKEMYAVNIFDDKNITDYGDYLSVELLNTTDNINQNGDEITFSSSADRVYYKGKMKSTIMPWNISIKYYVDGKEYTPEEAAGKSGKMEIYFKVSKNEAYDGSFYDAYALQASFILDTEIAKNITAADATLANVGNKKQLTYTILPGEGIDTVITADVTDFEMDAVSINGIPLNMNIQVKDEELMNKVDELLGGIEDIDNGADELNSGVNRLSDATRDDLQPGVNQLNDGMKDLNDGVLKIQDGLDELNSKSYELTSGSAQVLSALNTINSQLNSQEQKDSISQLVSGSAGIKDGITNLTGKLGELQAEVSYAKFMDVLAGNGLSDEAISQLELSNTQIADRLGSSNPDAARTILENNQVIEGLKSVINQYLTTVNTNITALYQGAQSLNTEYAKLDAGIRSLAVSVQQLADGVNQLVSEYGKLDKGVNEYTEGVAKVIAGYSQIVTGTSDLLSGSGELRDGTAELVNSIAELYDGTSQLKDGTGEMRDETDGMDTQITDKIDEMVNGITGGNYELVSFVSEKNTNVKAVQFVIQTESVQIKEADEATPVVEEKLNFWQKVLKLFGID